MSNASSKANVPWNPWLGAFLAVVLFIGAQILAALILSLIPVLAGWSSHHAEYWLNNSLVSKFLQFGLTSFFILLPLYLFFKNQKISLQTIGLRRPKWSDALYSLGAFPIYILLFAIITAAIKVAVPSLDLNQAQDLGFNASYHGFELIFLAIALVILPPLTEEIVFRGMLYSSLKKGMPMLLAAIVTSILFAAGHLLESGDGSLLYIAGIDTLVLSLILIYLREKSGGLWASIGLHALKNGLAFISLFVLNIH